MARYVNKKIERPELRLRYVKEPEEDSDDDVKTVQESVRASKNSSQVNHNKLNHYRIVSDQQPQVK